MISMTGTTACMARTTHRPAERAVIVIAGPTASGKSALALGLAERLGGVIINADSMQVYRDLTILTARPGPADEARAPHRLYGVLPGDTPCSAGRWLELALAEINAALAAGRRPIVVGGTGLYLKALTEGIADIPPVPEAVRAEARARHARLGGAVFHAELARCDPAMADRLAPGDTQRLIRAWEVRHATGRSLAEWQAAPPAGPPPGLTFAVFALRPPRSALYAACDGRFGRMVEAGALDEVRALEARRLDPALPVMKALGVPELRRHLRGELPLDAAIGLARQATRRYAKRQMTWLRHQIPPTGEVVVINHAFDQQYSESLTSDIFNIIRIGR
jgi:tRNA dimethylallyltransferase